LAIHVRGTSNRININYSFLAENNSISNSGEDLDEFSQADKAMLKDILRRIAQSEKLDVELELFLDKCIAKMFRRKMYIQELSDKFEDEDVKEDMNDIMMAMNIDAKLKEENKTIEQVELIAFTCSTIIIILIFCGF
jgi:hypothetical protein